MHTHMQVPCQGHNESPDAYAVNAAVFEIERIMAFRPNDYILMHCTHGFNRTGARGGRGRGGASCMTTRPCVWSWRMHCLPHRGRPLGHRQGGLTPQVLAMR